ncbi:hypothetical protein, partial [Aliarcobacter butzleri]|uniref:hypothetical protein n=1 Tax=Aliarcobacter butzleri TaxID=28197 RepID=UPI002B250A03
FEIDINGEITDNWNLGVGYSQFEAKDADDNKINTSFPDFVDFLIKKVRIPIIKALRLFLSHFWVTHVIIVHV